MHVQPQQIMEPTVDTEISPLWKILKDKHPHPTPACAWGGGDVAAAPQINEGVYSGGSLTLSAFAQKEMNGPSIWRAKGSTVENNLSDEISPPKTLGKAHKGVCTACVWVSKKKKKVHVDREVCMCMEKNGAQRFYRSL